MRQQTDYCGLPNISTVSSSLERLILMTVHIRDILYNHTGLCVRNCVVFVVTDDVVMSSDRVVSLQSLK